MSRSRIVLGFIVPIVGMAVALVSAQTPAPALHYGEVPVRITTSFGNIDIAVDVEHAPITSNNFLKYVDAKKYDGATFYRLTRPDTYVPTPPNRPMMNIIQGGLDHPANPDAPKVERFDAIPLERTSVTGLKHVAGTVSMARGGPDTATSEFFILLDDQPSLDFGGKRFDDEQGAAAFGRVLAGMDVVRTIQQQGPMQDKNKQYLVTPIAMASIRRK